MWYIEQKKIRWQCTTYIRFRLGGFLSEEKHTQTFYLFAHVLATAKSNQAITKKYLKKKKFQQNQVHRKQDKMKNKNWYNYITDIFD